MALLDQIGPVMVGPSSSHTAGACRIALLARHCLLTPVRSARFVLHGSFAKTAKGHGTELALVAGLCGAFPDDPRIRDAFDLARDMGLEYEFAVADLGDVHPNSVRIEANADGESLSLLGSSLGGGLVQVRQVNGFDARFSGSYYTLLALHHDQPGVIARVAGVVADDGGHPLALERLDGCAPVASYIATEKARSAAIGRRETKGYEDMVNGGRNAFLSAPVVCSLEGGMPVIVDGQVIGSVGVSGVTATQDAQVAKAGVAAVGN